MALDYEQEKKFSRLSGDIARNRRQQQTTNNKPPTTGPDWKMEEERADWKMGEEMIGPPFNLIGPPFDLIGPPLI